MKYNGHTASSLTEWQVCTGVNGGVENCNTGFGGIHFSDNYAAISSMGRSTQQGTVALIQKSTYTSDREKITDANQETDRFDDIDPEIVALKEIM